MDKDGERCTGCGKKLSKIKDQSLSNQIEIPACLNKKCKFYFYKDNVKT